MKISGEQHSFIQVFSISELCVLGNPSGIFQRLTDQAWMSSVNFIAIDSDKITACYIWEADMESVAIDLE